MGYTHYWSHPASDKESFAKFGKDVRAVLKKTKVKTQFEDDNPREPEINEEFIRFNGEGRDAHETFVVKRSGEDFGFCKTARKPYDEVVTACLLCAVDHLPGFSVSSDGIWAEWADGAALYEKATGRKAKMPFKDE